jgi:transcriptional regulator GlxA family with amidase domain
MDEPCAGGSYIGPSVRVASSIGLILTEIAALPTALPEDAMIVLAGNVSQTLDMSSAEVKDDDAAESEIVRWLKTAIRPEHMLVSICSGALLAGRAGLLDGRACTTHHSAYTNLVLAAPRAKVLENRLFVEDGRCYSSAGVTSGIDLMLHIVSRITDHRCAAEVARIWWSTSDAAVLTHSSRHGSKAGTISTRQFIACRMLSQPIHPKTGRWSLWRRLRGQVRHLSRLFYECTRMNIPDYRNRLRVALANDLLSQTHLDMEEVAERAGFASTQQLRRAWGRLHGTSPSESRSAISR